MTSRIALIMLACAVLATPAALAQSPALSCADESGTLLAVGSKGGYRLGLAGQGRERILELDSWRICFRCAGFPRLDLNLKDANAGAGEIRVFAEARICDGLGGATLPDLPASETYCIAAATVWVDNKDTRKCRFPQGTTLAVLWTALTRSPLPQDTETWWTFSRR